MLNWKYIWITQYFRQGKNESKLLHTQSYQFYNNHLLRLNIIILSLIIIISVLVSTLPYFSPKFRAKNKSRLILVHENIYNIVYLLDFFYIIPIFYMHLCQVYQWFKERKNWHCSLWWLKFSGRTLVHGSDQTDAVPLTSNRTQTDDVRCKEISIQTTNSGVTVSHIHLR